MSGLEEVRNEIVSLKIKMDLFEEKYDEYYNKPIYALWVQEMIELRKKENALVEQRRENFIIIINMIFNLCY